MSGGVRTNALRSVAGVSPVRMPTVNHALVAGENATR
jgi:hypothetical protein